MTYSFNIFVSFFGIVPSKFRGKIHLKKKRKGRREILFYLQIYFRPLQVCGGLNANSAAAVCFVYSLSRPQNIVDLCVNNCYAGVICALTVFLFIIFCSYCFVFHISLFLISPL